MIREDF